MGGKNTKTVLNAVIGIYVITIKFIDMDLQTIVWDCLIVIFFLKPISLPNIFDILVILPLFFLKNNYKVLAKILSFLTIWA